VAAVNQANLSKQRFDAVADFAAAASKDHSGRLENVCRAFPLGPKGGGGGSLQMTIWGPLSIHVSLRMKQV